MKRLLYLLLLLPLSVHAQIYERADSMTICRLLKKAPDNSGTLWFARQLLGRPYVGQTLEVAYMKPDAYGSDDEQLVVNTRQLDCTTLVETVTALTLCVRQGKKTWNDYLMALQTLRYRQGALKNYTSRLHYFSDWIGDKVSMQLVKEIQEPCPPFTGVQTLKVNYMSQHPQSYQALKAHPELIPVIRQQEEVLTGQTFRYIPKTAIRNTALLRQTVHDGDIIAITCNKPGLDIAHLGFAVWKKNGLHLLNASQLHKKVVLEPMTLYKYMQKHPSFTGIRIIRIK